MKRLSVSDLIDLPSSRHTIREKDTEYVKETADGEFSLDMESIVADVLNSGARVAPDLRIDDRDLKEYPNFYEWCFSKDGGNQAPFAKQLALATHLLAEYCVSGDSWLHTNKGMVRIKDLAPKPGLNPIKAKVTARKGVRKVTFGGLTKRQAKTLKITYSNGMFIEVTPEHKVLVATPDHTFKWVRAKNLSVGDYGVIPLGHDLWSKKDCILPRLLGSYHKSTRIYKTPSKMTPELARLIGYHLTNGSKSKYTIDFCTPDVNVMQDYRAIFKKVFGIKPPITRSYLTSKGDKYQECAVNSQYLSDWFDLIGLTGICYNKFIPDCVLQSSKSCITNLLRGIFDCAGYIDCTKDVTRLGIKLANTNLCYQIFMLLINLGIYSVYAEEIRTDNMDKVERKYGTIWVRTPDAWAKYKETIGSIHIKKSKALEELTILPEFFEYAEALVKPQKFVKSVVSNNLVFSQIASIGEGKIQDVYDITVPKGENFICNGVVVHNCPRCSSKAFRNIHKIPVDFPAKDFPDKVQFLHHGVCPKCGARKSELVKSGELNPYVELDVCAGQRCITGDSLVLTDIGYRRIKDMLPGADYGYTNKLSLVHNGKALTYMTKFFRAKAEPLYKVTLRSGLTIIGTKDHPVKTNEGFIKLPDLLGKYVETPIGTDVYGSNVLSNEQLVEYIDYDYVPDCILQATKDVQLTFLRMIGIDFDKVFRIRNHKMLGDVALLLRNMGYYTSVRAKTMKISKGTPYDVLDRCVYVERVNEEETYDIRVPNGHTFIANGILNHNSGKSAYFNLFVPYLLHKWVKVEKPVETLGLMSSSILIGTCTALTWAKAQELLYDPISNAIENSKWFQQYFALLDDYEERTGIELYKFKDTFLSFNHKNIILNTSGPNKRTLRGACLVGSTMINTNQGYLHFNELISKKGQHEICNMQTDTHLGKRDVSHTYMTKRNTIKITTRNGYTIEGTEEHPLLVCDKDLNFVWKPIKSLQTGDWLVTKTAQSKPMGGTYKISKRMARILGFMTANGYINELATDDPYVIKQFEKDVQIELGFKPKRFESNDTMRSGKCYLEARHKYHIKTSVFHTIFDRYGYTATNSKEKCIPISVRMGSKKVLHEFLHAYFMCDNYVDGDPDNTEIHISSRSSKLIREIQTILLQNYGIVTRYHKRNFIPVSQRNKKKPKWSISYILSMTGYDVYLFAHNFPNAKSVRKYKDRINLVTKKAGYGSDRRRVPYVKQWLFNQWDIARLKDLNNPNKVLRRLKCLDGTTILNSIRPACFSTSNDKATAQEWLVYEDVNNTSIISILKHTRGEDIAQQYKKFIQAEAHFEEVVKIESKSRAKKVYDLTVPTDHCFYANGIASHNTRLLAITDEIGWFPHGEDNDERERASANEVYVSLDRSLKTVRKATLKLLKEGYDSIPLGYGCGISSPSSYNDKIMELVRNFKGSKEVLVHQAPTWEMNPLFTKEDFAKEYQDDPIKAERDFGANPPMAENAWISDVKALDHLLTNRWVIDYQYDHFVNRSGVDMVYGKLRSFKAPPTCPPTVLTIDAGYSNNSFALAITANDGRGANVLAVAEIAPRKGVTVINYTRTVKNLLYPLIKAFNVQAVGADRWNSLKLLQDIEEDCKVHTFQYSLRPTDFDLVYDYLMEDIPSIKLPKPEMELGQIFLTSDYPHGFKYRPNSHLYHQFSTVNVDGRGSVEKGNGYTDDILRAVALGIRTCVLEDTIKKYNLNGATKQTRYAIGARSGSTQSVSSSSIGSKTGSSGSGSFGSRG